MRLRVPLEFGQCFDHGLISGLALIDDARDRVVNGLDLGTDRAKRVEVLH